MALSTSLALCIVGARALSRWLMGGRMPFKIYGTHSTARRQEENKMTASSLATIFLPALLPQVVEHGSSAGITKLSGHITFMIRHARKIIMPPIEIVNLVQKFYPDCLKNMPPAPPATGKSRPGAKVVHLFILF